MSLIKREYKSYIMLMLSFLLFSCTPAKNNKEVSVQDDSLVTLENTNVIIQFNKQLHSRVISK